MACETEAILTLMPVQIKAAIKNKIAKTPKIPTVPTQVAKAEAPELNTVDQKID